MSYSDLSSDDSNLSSDASDDETVEEKKSVKEQESDTESVEYCDARLVLDIFDFKDFNVVRYVLVKLYLYQLFLLP